MKKLKNYLLRKLYRLCINEINSNLTKEANFELNVYLKSKVSLTHFTSISKSHFPTINSYRKLHTQYGYQNNNWGIEHINSIQKKFPKARRILEIGAGNGKFIDNWKKYSNIEIHGIDLINPKNHTNISTIDINAFDSYKDYDLIVSFDFLEHLDIKTLMRLLKIPKFIAANHYHVIACYDDLVSHKTVWRPSQWLYLFKTFNRKFEFGTISFRREFNRKLAVTIIKT